MNFEELKAWVTRTADRFPAVGELFEQASDMDDLARSWASVLEKVTPEEASACIEAMLEGKPEPPKYRSDWSRLPAIVKRWASDNKALELKYGKFTPDHRTFKCLHCFDKGWGVHIFSPEWVLHHRTEIELGELGDDWDVLGRKWCRERGLRLTGCVDCSCEKGREVAAGRRVKAMVFWPGHHCKVPGGGPKDWLKALEAWVKEHPLEQTNSWVHASGYLENKS